MNARDYRLRALEAERKQINAEVLLKNAYGLLGKVQAAAAMDLWRPELIAEVESFTGVALGA